MATPTGLRFYVLTWYWGDGCRIEEPLCTIDGTLSSQSDLYQTSGIPSCTRLVAAIMRNLLAVALLLSAGCDAASLRKGDEGFEVVGGSPVRETPEIDFPGRELEEVDAVKEYVEDEREYVSLFVTCKPSLIICSLPT